MFSIIKNLCTPAYVYLIISTIAISIIAIQNLMNNDTYCLGNYTCRNTDPVFIFIFKIMWVIFWTWLLNMICSRGGETGKNIAWVLVLIPYVILFILLSYFILPY